MHGLLPSLTMGVFWLNGVDEMPMGNQSEIADLQTTVRQLERQLEAVRKIAASLSASVQVHDLVRECLGISLDFAESDAGSILLYHPDTDKLVFEYVVGEKAGDLTGMELPADKGIAGKVFKTGETSIAEDVTKDSAHVDDVDKSIGFRTINMVTVPLKAHGGEPIGVMQVLNKRGGPFSEHDITLIEIMAAQIAVAIETARLNEQARLAMVVRFIGDISHDVKNMVTPAMTGAQTLGMITDDCFARLDEIAAKVKCIEREQQGCHTPLGELREIYPEMLQMITESCNAVQQRMAEIASAIKGMVSAPSFDKTDVGAVAQRVGSMLKAHGQKKGVSVIIDPDPEMPHAMVDPKQIYNAMYNLIFNAIDACSDGNTVTLRVYPDSEGGFVMECEDDGPGIPDEVKAKLFTDHAISTKPMGTGLGTKIVKNVVDAHKGTIELDSQVGVGTTVRCRIPAGGGG